MYIRVNMRCRCCGLPCTPKKYSIEEAKNIKRAAIFLESLKDVVDFHACSPTEFGIAEPVSIEVMEVSDENNS